MNIQHGEVPLSRSLDDRMIAGVLGGLARRLGWDPTWLRIGYVLLSVLSAAFPGILVYLVMWLLIPNESD
jgi:phage shock protein C